MKLNLMIVFLILPMALKCQIIDSLHVYYLPWKFSAEGGVTEDMVRNYSKHSRKMVIVDREKINGFISSLSIFNLRQQEEGPAPSFSPRMVIDVFSHSRYNDTNSPVYIYTIKLNQRQNLVFRDRIYYKNFALEEWINKYVVIDE